MNIKKVFISHITSEKEIANILKNSIQNYFNLSCDVFVSSCPYDIYGGENWLSILESKLTEADLLIVLCSPSSIKSSWVHFEVGYATSKEIPIIPIWHRGLSISTAPVFINRYLGYNLDQESCLDKIILTIRDKLKIKISNHKDLSNYKTEIKRIKVKYQIRHKPAAYNTKVYSKFKTWASEINHLINKLDDHSEINIMSWLSTFALSRNKKTYYLLKEKLLNNNIDVQWVIGTPEEADKFFRSIINNYQIARKDSQLCDRDKKSVLNYINENLGFLSFLLEHDRVNIKCATHIPFHLLSFCYSEDSISAFDLSEVGDYEKVDWRFTTSNRVPIRGFIVSDKHFNISLESRFTSLFLSPTKSKPLDLDEYTDMLFQIKKDYKLK